MIESYSLCKEFSWTPNQLDEVDLQWVQDVKELISIRRKLEEREQKAAEARARR